MNEINDCAHARRVPDSSRVASNPADVQDSGLWAGVEKHRRSIAWLLGGFMLPAVVFTRSYWPLHDPIHEAFEALGLLMVVGYVAGRVFCTVYIGGRKNEVLMRHGPYSVVRNPLYLFSVLGVSGIGFSTGSGELGILFGFTAYLLFSAIIRAEEARLLHRFGGDYRAYLLKVPRWLPDFRNWADSLEAEVIHSALVWRTLRDGFGLLFLVPVVEGVEQAQALGMFPVMLALR